MHCVWNLTGCPNHLLYMYLKIKLFIRLPFHGIIIMEKIHLHASNHLRNIHYRLCLLVCFWKKAIRLCCSGWPTQVLASIYIASARWLFLQPGSAFWWKEFPNWAGKRIKILGWKRLWRTTSGSPVYACVHYHFLLALALFGYHGDYWAYLPTLLER